MKKVFKKLRNPYLSIFLAGLVLFVSCNQYEKPNTEILDSQTVEAIQNATKEFLKNPENFKPQKKGNNNNDSYLDVLLKEAIEKYASDDLNTYKQDVLNYSNWNNDQLTSIEASFIVMTTIQDDYYSSSEEKQALYHSYSKNSKRAAWWAPIAFAGICLVVGVLSVGIAGAACGIMFATLQSVQNRT
jgi:hypothetical protein